MHFAPASSTTRIASADGRLDLRVDPGDEVLLRDPHGPALDPLAEELPVVGDLLRDRGRFPRVVAGDDVHQDGAVLHVLREGADLVQRRGEGDQAVAGDPAVGRLHPDDAAEGRRLADGAARVGAEGGDALVGGHRRRGAAARAAGDPLEIPGVPGRAEVGGLRGGAHGELVHVRLAGEDGARRPELLHDRGVVGRDEVVEDPGAAGRPDPLRAEDVLQGDGDPGQRPDLALSDLLVGLRRLGQGRLPHQGDVGVDLLFHGVDPPEDGGGDLGGGRLPRPEFVLQFVNGQLV